MAYSGGKYLKVLFIGLGSIGQRHLRNLKSLYGENLKIIAYRSRGLSTTFGEDMKVRENVNVEEEYNIQVFYDLNEALSEKPEICFVTNITSEHLKVSLACAKAGCHIFLEKPVSDSLDGINELEEEARKRNIIIYVGFQNRFHPGILDIKKDLKTETIGSLISVSAEVGERLTTMHLYEDYKDTYMAKRCMGGGIILNQVIHELDYIAYLFGFPKSVYAVGGNTGLLGIDVDDYVNAIFTVRNADRLVPVIVTADFYQYPPARNLKIVGEKGSISINLLTGDTELIVGETVKKRTYSDFKRNQMFVEELKDFLNCVQRGQKAGISLEEGLKSLRMAIAIKKSIEKGTIIHELDF